MEVGERPSRTRYDTCRVTRAFPSWFRSLAPLVAVEARRRFGGSPTTLAWLVVGPALEIGVYVLVLSTVLGSTVTSDGIPLALIIASGVMPWTAVRESVEGSCVVLRENRWIRRSRVPLGLLTSRHVIASSLRGFAGTLIVLCVAAALGTANFGRALVFTPLALCAQTALAWGVSRALIPLAAQSEDLRPWVSSILGALVFAAPVVYPEASLPAQLRGWIEWNPFTHILRLYRLGLGGLAEPNSAFLLCVCVGAVFLGIGVGRLWDKSARDLL